MPIDLCWSADHTTANPSLLEVLPESFIAPSWSWPSMQGPLKFVDPELRCVYEPLPTVVDVKCEVPRLNKYGEVADRHLILRGPVVPMTVNCMDPSSRWTYSVGKLEATIAPDCLLVIFE